MLKKNANFYLKDVVCDDSSEVKIIGIGCGGCNIVNHMMTNGFKEASLAVCDMDKDVVKRSNVSEKLLIGSDGLGAGNKPETGREEAVKNIKAIKSMFKNTKVAVVVSCFGGGCGTGATPVIAQELKKLGITTIGVVTLPFAFEGEKKFVQATEGIGNMERYTDFLFLFNNQYIMNNNADLSMTKAFAEADNLIGGVVKTIISAIVNPQEQFEKISWTRRIIRSIIEWIYPIHSIR